MYFKTHLEERDWLQVVCAKLETGSDLDHAFRYADKVIGELRRRREGDSKEYDASSSSEFSIPFSRWL